MKATVPNVVSWLARLFTRDGKRVLVNEILTIQIISVGLVGALAIASLYWGGQWVLQDNYSRWALQWTKELNELGSPLYLADDGEALIRLESFVNRYPEIDRVAYFSRSGSVLCSFGNEDDFEDDKEPVADLSQVVLHDAVAIVGHEKPYLMITDILDPQRFEILAPVWKESIADDGLFGFDPSMTEEPAQTELLGFVSINLDFVIFNDRLLSNIKGAVLILLVLLLVFGFLGRRVLRNALAAISSLRKPLRELAKGNLGVTFEPAAHREIA